MLVGAFYFPTDYGIAIDELARELEARGFESLFVCEHTHIPVSRRTPFQGGGELPKRYSHTHDPVWLYPKPKQKPHPPVLLGGESEHTVRRVVEFCDGWFPRPRGNWEPKGAAARLRQAAVAAGRDPTTLSITVFNAPADAAALDSYREAGIARVLLEVPDASRDEVLRRLDKNGPLTRETR